MVFNNLNELFSIIKKNVFFAESSNNFNRVIKGMRLILNYADISTKGVNGIIKIKALTIIWLVTLREWNKGELTNEESIMAALDKRLTLAEKLNQMIL